MVAAISLHGGRLPVPRGVGGAVLSIVAVGIGGGPWPGGHRSRLNDAEIEERRQQRALNPGKPDND